MKKLFHVILIYLLPNTTIASGIVHEKILQWWTKMSEQKPLKCTLNPTYLKPFHPLGQKIIGTVHF